MVTDYSGDIGNTFGLKRILDGLKPTGLGIEVAESVVHEATESDLLADPGFERQMHPLVAAVLLGVPRLDALDRDPEPQRPQSS